ncbi:MAG: hypothetical protein C0605_09185 [Hyphomicrobiales bacterium]|nr:MAG: hypothetical protein C0605_09185 [Hyphomicrobiales bacterium]
MIRKGGPSDISEELTAILAASRAELIEQWISIYKKPPPKGISHRLLAYSAAYQRQVKAFGRLKLTAHRSPSRTDKRDKTAPTALQVGTRLIREWHGQTYTVDVSDQGFLCDGRHYTSLTQIASAITGVRWSGPRFFGL